MKLYEISDEMRSLAEVDDETIDVSAALIPEMQKLVIAREITLHAVELLASLEPDKQREILEGEDYWEIDPTDLKMLAKINGVMPAESEANNV